MKFSCGQCGKRFTTAEEPVPGRMYRVPCRCGNTIILQLDAAAVKVEPPPLPTAFRRTGPPPLPRTLAVPRRKITRPWPPPEPVQEIEAPPPPEAAPSPHGESAILDDPFARAAHAGEPPADAAPPGGFEAPLLARRDPDAPDDDSAELRVTSAPPHRPPWRRLADAVAACRVLASRAADVWIAAKWRARAAVAGMPRVAAFVAAAAPAPLRTPLARSVASAVMLGIILVAAVASTSSSEMPPPRRPPIALLPAHEPPGEASQPVSPPSVPAGAAAAPGRGGARSAADPAASGDARRPAGAARREAAFDHVEISLDARPDGRAERAAASEPAPGRMPTPGARTPARPAVARAGAAGRDATAPARAPAPLESRPPAAEASPDAVRSAAPARAKAEPSSAAAKTAPAASPGPREVRAALRERRAAVEACIAEGPVDGAGGLAGRRFLLLVVVEPGGTVSDARVDDSDVASTSVAACLVRVARELSFPPFEGEPASVPVSLRYRDSE